MIVELSFDFGLKMIKFCDKLQEAKKFVIGNQLLRAGLSIGANVREAQNAESFADFLHKMKIAGKEAEETKYYLQLITKSYTYEEATQLLADALSIIRVLTKIISTSNQKQ